MTPANTYLYLCCMSSCLVCSGLSYVLWQLSSPGSSAPFKWVSGGNSLPPPPPHYSFFGNQPRDNYIKMPPLICHHFVDSLNRELKHARFWDADGNRKWAVFPLTGLHTTTFILPSIFSPLEMISITIWETPQSWHAKFRFRLPSASPKRSYLSSLMSTVLG